MDAEPRASGVVLSCFRPGNLPAVCRRLAEQPWIDDVTVWHNGPEPVEPHIDAPKPVVVRNAGRNCFVLGRFLGAALASHDIVCCCDDDSLLGNWPEVWRGFLDDPDRIAAALRPGHYRNDRNCRWGPAHEILLGWGSVFDRRWFDLAMAPYVANWGKDGLYERKADRLFSILLAREHTAILGDVTDLPGATGPEALYCRKDHWRLTEDARERALAILGIKG